MIIQQYQREFLDEKMLSRIEKLFRTSMRKYGPSITLLLKKIMMVAMWIHYYQENTHRERWIKFQYVLERNEDLIIHSISRYYEYTVVDKKTIEWLIRKNNGCNGHSFFGLDGEAALQKSLDALEREIIDYCNNAYKHLVNID